MYMEAEDLGRDRPAAAGLQRLDRITIHDLFLRCIVGINPEERRNRQDVVINISLFADLEAACTSDNIDDTINYKSVKEGVVSLVEGSSFFLVERLAEEIARSCLSHSQVRAVQVSVEKPGALRFARSVGVEIYREAAG
jgi:FolB domain-containing protein